MNHGTAIWPEVGVLVAAMIGGAIVILGLIVERFAEWLDDRFIPQYKAHKWLEDFGLGFVVLGILGEIIVGGWAANDAWQTKQMAIKNDPNNFPITLLEAYVVIETRSTGFDTNNLSNFSQATNPEQIRVSSFPPSVSNMAVMTVGSVSNNWIVVLQGFNTSKSLVDITNGENLRYDNLFIL